MFVVCCLVFVFLLRVLFFSCGLFAFGYFVVRRSCLVFAPFVDLILVTGFFLAAAHCLWELGVSSCVFISNYVSVTINSAICVAGIYIHKLLR